MTSNPDRVKSKTINLIAQSKAMQNQIKQIRFAYSNKKVPPFAKQQYENYDIYT